MYARPIPFLRTGENVPEVTSPIRFSDLSKISLLSLDYSPHLSLSPYYKVIII